MDSLGMLKEAQELLAQFVEYAERMHLSSEAVSTLMINASKKLVLDALDKLLVHVLGWALVFYIVFLTYRFVRKKLTK